MSVEMQCPRCAGRLRVTDELLGRLVQCPHCRHQFVAGARVPPPPVQPVVAAHMYSRPESDRSAVTSLVLGCIGMVAWCIPIIGFPITIIGLVMGIKGMDGPSRGMAVAGTVLSGIGLALTVITLILNVMILLS